MSVLERGGTNSLALTLKLSAIPDSDIATTIVSYEEQCRGWLAKTAREKDEALIRCYAQLGQNIAIYASLTLLPYNQSSHSKYLEARRQKVRVGTQDLKIASICLANDAILLTRNIADFSQIPGLRCEDWTY
jgi:tRNA(fMet)-specific endonuclease VapC